MAVLKLSLAFGLMVTMNHWSHACVMWCVDQSKVPTCHIWQYYV